MHLAHIEALIGRQVLIARLCGSALLHLSLPHQPRVLQRTLCLLDHRLSKHTMLSTQKPAQQTVYTPEDCIAREESRLHRSASGTQQCARHQMSVRGRLFFAAGSSILQ